MASLWLAVKRGYSFVEVISRRLDSVFVGVLQGWCNQLWKSGNKTPG